MMDNVINCILGVKKELNKLGIFYSNEKDINLKSRLPQNSEIALSEICFRNYSNNLQNNSKIIFNLTINELKSKVHLPSIDIEIKKNFFSDLEHLKNEILYHLEKKYIFLMRKNIIIIL